MSRKSFSDIKLNDRYVEKKTISEDIVVQFANVTGDKNPLHLDEEYAKKTIFKKRIVHGMLIGSYFSAIIANKLPGPGSIYLYQDFSFKKPIFLNENVTLEVRVIEKKPEKNVLILETKCFKENNEVAVTGKAVILYKN